MKLLLSALVGTLLGYIVVAVVIFTYILFVVGEAPVQDHNDWKCTASRAISEALPREEECTQYTKNGVQHE